MHVFRDSGAIRGAVAKLPEVAPLLSKRIEELSEYVGDDLSSLVNILVVQARDTLADSRTYVVLRHVPILVGEKFL